MSLDGTTSLDELENIENEPQQHPQHNQQHQQHQQQMHEQQMHQQQMQQMQQQRDIAMAAQQSQEPVKKGYMDSFKEMDYKSIILVFAILLVLTNGMFLNMIRSIYGGAAGPDGKTTLVGSLIISLIGTIFFVLVRFLAKF